MATWNIDPMHSEVQFKIKHLVISTVTGSFRKFEGQVVTEGKDFNKNSRKAIPVEEQYSLNIDMRRQLGGDKNSLK